MIFLARAILQSQQRALLVAMLLGALTLLVSPVGILAGAAIALVVLVLGSGQGMKMLLATGLGGAVMTLVAGSGTAWLLSAAEFWVPAWLFALVLLRTQSLSQLVQLVVLVCGSLLVLVYALGASPEVFWAALMQQLVDGWRAQDLVLDVQAEVMLLEKMPQVLTMLIAMALASVWLGMVFLARWWQGVLYNPGGFGADFRALQLPAWMAWVAAILFVLPWLMDLPPLLQALLAVLTLAFLLQGLAVVHQWVQVRGTGKGWLTLIYVLLAVLPHMMVLMATLGWMENWTRWREKMAPDSTS